MAIRVGRRRRISSSKQLSLNTKINILLRRNIHNSRSIPINTRLPGNIRSNLSTPLTHRNRRITLLPRLFPRR